MALAPVFSSFSYSKCSKNTAKLNTGVLLHLGKAVWDTEFRCTVLYDQLLTIKLQGWI